MLNQTESYILGFLQTDGHFSKDNKRISIEISAKDIDILQKIRAYFNETKPLGGRTRNTNFMNNYKCVSFDTSKNAIVSIFRPFLPSGSKSLLIESPKHVEYSEIDYWRGIFDGDGSLGIKSKRNETYISLTTASEQLFIDLKAFIRNRFGWELNVRRNKRDNIYNITFVNHKAYKLAHLLYHENTIAIDRKYKLAVKVINFDYRSISQSKVRIFTREEDDIILKLDHKDAVTYFGTQYEDPPKLLGNTIACRRKCLKTLLKYELLK